MQTVFRGTQWGELLVENDYLCEWVYPIQPSAQSLPQSLILENAPDCPHWDVWFPAYCPSHIVFYLQSSQTRTFLFQIIFYLQRTFCTHPFWHRPGGAGHRYLQTWCEGFQEGLSQWPGNSNIKLRKGVWFRVGSAISAKIFSRKRILPTSIPANILFIRSATMISFVAWLAITNLMTLSSVPIFLGLMCAGIPLMKLILRVEIETTGIQLVKFIYKTPTKPNWKLVGKTWKNLIITWREKKKIF